MTQVTRQIYIEDLAKLQHTVVTMGEAATLAVKKSMEALLTGNKQLAEEVMQGDDLIDDMMVDIEDRGMLLIAKQQPIAHDLRIIATSFKLSTDLERIGDHAFDIAKIARDLSGEFAIDVYDTPRLGSCAVKMIEMAIESYRTADIKLAEQVCRADDEMDELFARTFQQLSAAMGTEPLSTKQATQLIFVARFLERVGDHATNIAEWVIYLETAERIRKTK